MLTFPFNANQKINILTDELKIKDITKMLTHVQFSLGVA